MVQREEGCICLCDRGMLPLSVMLHISVELLETLGTPDGSTPSNLHEAASRHSCCIFTALRLTGQGEQQSPSNGCVENACDAKLLYP